MKKIILSVLIVLMSVLLFTPDVYANGDHGFTVYAFTSSDTTHNLPDDLDLSEITVFVDGRLIYEDGILIDENWQVRNSPLNTLIIDEEYDLYDYIVFAGSENTYGKEIENNIGVSVVIIVGNPDSFDAWGYTVTDTVHTIPDNLDIENEFVIIMDGRIAINLGVLTPGWFVSNNYGNAYHIEDDNQFYTKLYFDTFESYDSGDIQFEDTSNVVLIQAHNSTPNQMNDFVDYIEYPNNDRIETDATGIFADLFKLWQNPSFPNRLYLVPNNTELYISDGLFSVFNSAFATASGDTIPSYIEDEEFDIEHIFYIGYDADDDGSFTDYYSHLKITYDENMFSVPISDTPGDQTFFIKIVATYFWVDSETYQINYVKLYVNDALITAIEDDLMIYLETLPDNVVPDFDGQAWYSTTYDQPITEAGIRANLAVWDAVDGDLTSQIILVSDNYTPNASVVGSWTINYSVTDSSNNTSTFVVTVVVFDNLSPVITGGQSSYTVSYTQTFNTVNMLNAHTATDDHDGAVPITIKSNTYTANKTVPGTYQIVISAKDSSNNETTKTITIYVVDDVAPVITAPAIITKDATTTLTLQQILSQVTASDAIDGNVTNLIQVISNQYAGKSMMIGEWSIVIRVSDQSGNSATKTIVVEVIDELPGVWYVVDGFFLNVNPSVQLSIQNIITTLVLANEITEEEASTVTVVTDNYSDNYATVGNHTVTLNYVSSGVTQTLALTMRVSDFASGGLMYTVVFITNGGSYIVSQLIEEGSLVTRPTDPTRTGYTFAGWFEDEALTQPWSFTNNTITQDTNLYAKWTLDQTSQGTPSWVLWLEQYWILGVVVIILAVLAFGRRGRRW